MFVWMQATGCVGCTYRIPVAVHCSLVERSTAAGWRAAAGQSPADTGPAVDCTESYLEVYTQVHMSAINYMK